MRRRSSVLFIILNVIISAVVALGLLNFLGGSEGGGSSQMVPITVQILVTATPDPDGDATRIASAVDATLTMLGAEDEATSSVDLPPDILTDLPGTPGQSDSAQAGGETTTESGLAVPDGCIVHTLAEGENPAALADEYGVTVSAILIANQLTEDDARFLQIDDELIIPLPDCPVEQIVPPTETPEPTLDISPTPTLSEADQTEAVEATSEAETATAAPTTTASPTPEEPTSTPSQTPTPTPDIAPTALDAQVRIVEVLGPGDITAEGIRIVNEGSAVNVAGWTITDAQENEYVLPEQRLFTNGSVTIYTRPGEDTPIVFYWGRSTAVWGDEGDVATLRDAGGSVQSSVRIDELNP